MAEPQEIIESIKKVSAAAKQLLSSDLNERAIALLIQQAVPGKTKPTQKTIMLILEAASNLDTTYLKNIEPEEE